MWPKLLDLTEDECRGTLRRLELESYSNVVGTFRAQGTLNAMKLRILKDLRKAFHISDVRHKAEVRRVVNDESLSTIAKMMYGPNSEIEWNKEGCRGFLIINRKPSQTALSSVVDSATELGDAMNKQLKQPADTSRDHMLSIDQDVKISKKIVINDPSSNQAKVKTKIEAPVSNGAPNLNNAEKDHTEPIASMAKKKDSIKTNIFNEQSALNKTSSSNNSDDKPPPKSNSDKIESIQMPMAKQITQNSRRRKSTTSLANHCAPPKAIVLSNRRDTMIETSFKIREHPPPMETPIQPSKSQNNEIRIVPKEIADKREEISVNVPIYSSNTLHRTNEAEVQVIEAVVPHKIDTIKGTRNVMNAISQGAQLVKVIDSKIIKKPITITNSYAQKPAQVQTFKAATTIKQTFASMKASTVDYLAVNDCMRLAKSSPIKTHKIQVIPSDAQSMANNVNIAQRTINHNKNDIISIPTARNPNIVKTSDKTIMHVSNLPLKRQIKKPIIPNNLQNYQKYQQKHVVKVIQPQVQPRTVTIHPNPKILKVPAQVSSINELPQEYVYEEHINDWQNYDPRRIDNQNGYIIRNTPNNGRDYQNHAPNLISENIVYDEDIITEEYITSEEFSADNVIEMEVDSANYTTEDMVLVSSNVIS